MVDQNKPPPVALHIRREVVIEALSTHFANDALDVDEFEQRVDRAHRATSVAALDELLADLRPPADVRPSESVVPRSEIPLPSARIRAGSLVPGLIRDRGRRVLSILSEIQRKGTWRVPKRLRVVALMGSVDLDFREAQFGPGVTEVRVRSVMGAIAIIVPPHLQVECEGRAILGTFEGMEQGTGELDPDAPLLRITGAAIMGSVEIATRSPGEPMKADGSADIGEIGSR